MFQGGTSGREGEDVKESFGCKMEQHVFFLFCAFVGQAKPQVLLVLLSVSFFHWKLQFLSLVYLGEITAVPRPGGMPDGKCSLLFRLAGHIGLIYSLLACGGCSES